VAAAPPGDLVGPGVAVDETAQVKHGDATACVAPQHAGCTGKVENCVTTVFSACPVDVLGADDRGCAGDLVLTIRPWSSVHGIYVRLGPRSGTAC
jgi:hypothetical protein